MTPSRGWAGPAWGLMKAPWAQLDFFPEAPALRWSGSPSLGLAWVPPALREGGFLWPRRLRKGVNGVLEAGVGGHPGSQLEGFPPHPPCLELPSVLTPCLVAGGLPGPADGAEPLAAPSTVLPRLNHVGRKGNLLDSPDQPPPSLLAFCAEPRRLIWPVPGCRPRGCFKTQLVMSRPGTSELRGPRAHFVLPSLGT